MKHKKLPKLDLNITNRCNFRCVHCAFDSGKKEMEELTLKEIEKILIDTKQLGGEKFDITGGEPTLRKDLGEIIRIGKKLGYKMELITNGSLITREKMKKYKELGLDSLTVSIDGSTYEIYKRIRKVSGKKYERALQVITDAVELGYNTKVNTVAFSSNLEDLPNITEFCIKNGVKEHGIYYFTPVGRGSIGSELSVEPVKWLKFLREKMIKYDSHIKLSVEFPLIEKNFPKQGLDCILKEDPYHMQILPDGNVYPCAILASYGRPIGNLKKTSIKNIWDNKILWKEYYSKISEDVFQKYNGFCANFSCFDLKDYNKSYRFVCPLRKFNAGELK